MLLRRVLDELLLLKKNGGYVAYHYLGRPLSVREEQCIYRGVKADFSIKWDLYYLEMTLAVSLFPRIARVFLLIHGNYSLWKFVLGNSGWVYEANYDRSAEVCEVYFRDSERSDMGPFLGYPECSITRKNRRDALNVLRHLRVHFTFRRLFAGRVDYLARKFENAVLPKTVILQEGRSLEYRSLYAHARAKNTNIEFSWKYPGSIFYDETELFSQSNLDYPGRLHRRPYIKNEIVKLAGRLKFEEDVLIVVPTFNSMQQNLQWVRSTIAVTTASGYFLSVHPTYRHLRPALLNEPDVTIDDLKSEYMRKYKIFIGCYSTLLAQAVDNGKTVIAIGYNKDQIERMNASLSNFTIHDASALAAG